MNSRWLEWSIAYILGVISSITASLLLFFFQSNRSIQKMLHYLTSREAQRRLQAALLKENPDTNDARTFIRTQWAGALIDIGSNLQDEVLMGIHSLDTMVDLLQEDEKIAAYEVLKLKHVSNQHRNLDARYINTMQRLMGKST